MRGGLLVLVLPLLTPLSSPGLTSAACTVDAQCSDTNPCTVDRCESGACVHLPNDTVCDDGNVCTDDLCDTSLGCLHADNGGGCNDAVACTTQDTCVAGACIGGPPAAGCTPCQAAAAIPPQGGTFVGRTSGTGTLAGSCGTSSPAPERVYAWTPAISGPATFSTCGNGTLYDSVLYVRSGTCGGAEVACNDDTAGCITGEPNDHHGSRITATVTAGQAYYIVVDGYAGAAGTYALTVVPPSLCGNGVREGSEECDGAAADACADGRCTATCTCVVPPGGLPDLMAGIADVSVTRGVSVSQGDVAEGCAERASNVDLLRFSVSSINAGTADLILGNPLCPSPCSDHPLEVCGNPDFVCSPAAGHNHPHYTHYARYELLNAASQTVVVGHKQGFCLRDTNCASPFYTCTNQGISAGCYDVYGANLGCQYLDVTGVPPGAYTLRVRMDPFARIPELSEANNVVTVPVTLPSVTSTSTTSPVSTTTSTTSPTPTTTSTTSPGGTTTSTTVPSGACAVATVLPAAGGTFTGVTSGASTISICVPQTATAPEQVFRWTPAVAGTATVETCGSGTAYDTVVSVRSGSCTSGPVVGCNDDTAGCASGNGCATADHHGSRVAFPVSAGQPYWIIVDGYAGSCGGSSGAFTLRLTPPVGAVTTTTVASATTTSTSRSTTTTTSSVTTTTSSSTTTTTSSSTTTTSSITTTTRLTTTSSTTTSTTSSSTTTMLADGCAAPSVIPAGGGRFKGRTKGVSAFAGTCGGNGGAPERVYQWTPTRSGIATVDTCASRTEYDTVVYVRLADCRVGAEVACNDDGCAEDRSRVRPLVVAGLTYYIFVDGWSGQAGDFELRVTPP